MKRWKKVLLGIAIFIVAVIIGDRIHAKMYPLWHLPRHRHCLKQTGLGLKMYAADHGDRFPVHTNGYADALLLASRYVATRTRESDA